MSTLLRAVPFFMAACIVNIIGDLILATATVFIGSVQLLMNQKQEEITLTSRFTFVTVQK